MRKKGSSKAVAPLFRRKRVYAALAVGLICLLSGAVAIGLAIRSRQRLQSADAQILFSEPVTFKRGGQTLYRTQVELLYLVHGERHMVTASMPEVAGSREELDDQLRRYRPGATLPIVYDPAETRRFELDFGSPAHIYRTPAVLLGIGLLSLVYVIVAAMSDGRYHCAACGTGVPEQFAYCFLCGERIPRRKGKMSAA
ncbi:MAG TPA: DUF3592 domain-containing protein [Bryobacteraceae bacterium]|nr:DUF3592 domain-containing protein [Bryobacteraceae bacterium]